MNVGVLVLAAGRSERFGSDKRIASLPDGRRMIEAQFANVRLSGLPLLGCLGEHDDDMVQQLRAKGFDCIQCKRAAEGMGGTLAEGIGHVRAWEGVLVALADMPWIQASTYRAVAAHLTTNTLCQPEYEGTPGHPVGFGAAFFDALATLGGDAGGRELLRAHSDRVRRVVVEDPAIHRDVDRPEDLYT